MRSPPCRHTLLVACPLVGTYTIAGWYPGGACPFVGNPGGTGYAAAGGPVDSGPYPAAGGRVITAGRGIPYLPALPPAPAPCGTPPITIGMPSPAAILGSTVPSGVASGMPPNVAD